MAGTVLRIPSGSPRPGRLLPRVAAEDDMVDPGGQVAVRAQVPGAVPGHRHQHHRQPVAGEQSQRQRSPAPGRRDGARRARPRGRRRRSAAGPGDAGGRPVDGVEREPTQEEAEGEEDRGPPHDLPVERAPVAAGAREPPGEGVGNGDADREEEEGKDEVGRRPAVPLGMEERSVGLVPVPGVVHQDHGGDGHSPERVQGAQALRPRRHGIPARELVVHGAKLRQRRRGGDS